MDVSFQGLGNPVTHNACVDCGTKKPNEDFLCYKCNQKSKITSHYFPILQLGTPSCKKVFNGNNLVGEQIFNMPAKEFGEKVLQEPNFVDTFVQEDCIGRWCRIFFQHRKNPRSEESICRVSHFEFLSIEEAAKKHLFPPQVHHPAPLNATCKHKWTVCLDGMPNSRRAVIQPLVVSMPFCESMVGILM